MSAERLTELSNFDGLTNDEIGILLSLVTSEKNKRLYEHSQIPAKVSELTQLYVEGGGDIKDIEAVI